MAGRFSVEAVFRAVDRVTAPVTRMQNKLGKFSRSIQSSMRKANAAINKVSSSLKSAAGTGLKLAAGGVTALAGAVLGLVSAFSKVEDAEAAFTPLLGGAAKAKKAIEALNQTAASTPFQFETLAQVAQTLLPVMDGSIENTIKTVRLLGDTAGGNAQKLQSITAGFTKSMLKGKVDLESLNMIAEAGVPIFQELAGTIGTDVNESFFKMISAGKITTKQLTQTFERMTAEGGKFFNGMDIASKTTSGLFSTFKDNLTLAAAEIGGALAPVVKELIKDATVIAVKIRAWAKENKGLIGIKFREFVDGIRTAVKGVIASLRDMNNESGIFERMKNIIIGIDEAFTFLREHGATIAKVVAGFIAFSLVLKTLIGIMTVVNLVMAANPITLIALAVVAAVAGFVALVTWIDEVAVAFSGMNPILRAFLSPLELIVRAIKFIKDGVTGGFGAALDDLKVAFGFDDEDEAAKAADAQVVTPQERIAKTIDEKTTTNKQEVTIKTEPGASASQTGGKKDNSLVINSSGAFI